MTPDPLCCQSQNKWDGGCQCDLIAKAHNRGYQEAEDIYTNSCVSCGYAGEWSTWMCANCAKEQS